MRAFRFVPKLFVFDEAWRFFRNPTTRAYIVEALKTWRKRNAAMILATQSSDDMMREEMLSVVSESCFTKIFLANPGMDPASYRETFHLNETEAAQIARLVPKQQFLLKTPELAKVLNLHCDPYSLRIFGNAQGVAPLKITTALNEVANPVGTLARKSPLFGMVWHLYRAAMAFQGLLKKG